MDKPRRDMYLSETVNRDKVFRDARQSAEGGELVYIHDHRYGDPCSGIHHKLEGDRCIKVAEVPPRETARPFS